MSERLLVVLAILAATVAIALLVRLVARKRIERVIGQTVPSTLRSRLQGRRPSIVYFYGPHCGPCEDQARALGDLVREQATQVVAIDATEERQLADALGALTIPTTAVLDRAGRVRWINLGYHPKATLVEQLASVNSAAVQREFANLKGG